MNRRPRSLAPLLLAVPLALALAACGGGSPPPEPIIPETTKVADAADLETLSSWSPEDGTLLFEAGGGFAADLEGGDVIVAEPTGAAPEGLLRRVVAVREEGGAVVVETEEAALVDAIDRGSVAAERALTPADLETAHLHLAGVAMSAVGAEAFGPQALADGFRFEFDETIVDEDGSSATTNDRLQISGYLDVQPILDFALDIDKFMGIPTGVRTFRVAVGLTERAEVRLVGDYDKAGRVEQRFSLATLEFSPLTFPVGPVPVVITPELELFLQLDGSIDATLRMRVEQSFEAQAGVQYTGGGGWEDLSRLEHDFTWDDPTYGAALNARAYTSARLGFKVYGSAGSYVTASAYGELDVDLFRDPIWRLSAGMTADVGLYAKVLSFEIADYSARVMDVGWELDSGSDAPTGPGTGPGTDPGTPDPSRVLFDAGHGFDSAWAGGLASPSLYFADLIAELEGNGYHVAVGSEPLPDALAGASWGVVVLAGPTAPYSAADIAALTAFVEAGGRLVLLGEASGRFGTPHLNAVAGAFGLHIDDDQTGDHVSAHQGNPNWPVTSHVAAEFAEGVAELGFFIAAPVSGSGDVVVRTDPTGFSVLGGASQPPMGMRAARGAGQAIALGDSDVFAVQYNDYDTGIRYYDNCRFALNVFGGGDCSFEGTRPGAVIAGTVANWTGATGAGVRLEMPSSTGGFYVIASAPLGADGSFSLELPTTLGDEHLDEGLSAARLTGADAGNCRLGMSAAPGDARFTTFELYVVDGGGAVTGTLYLATSAWDGWTDHPTGSRHHTVNVYLDRDVAFDGEIPCDYDRDGAADTTYRAEDLAVPDGWSHVSLLTEARIPNVYALTADTAGMGWFYRAY